MGRCFLASLVLLVSVVSDRNVLEKSRLDVDGALRNDDQCSHGSAHCALNALQMKVARASKEEVTQKVPDAESVLDDDLVSDKVAREDASWSKDEALDEDVGSEIVASENDPAVAEAAPMDALGLAQSASEVDPCRFGMVEKMREQGPECFDACPQICKPLAESVKAFFRGGGAPAATRSICMNKEMFYCTTLDENLDKCKPFVESARHMGVQLPQTVPGIEERCWKYGPGARI